jgi:tRNA dimethylallyltransferase
VNRKPGGLPVIVIVGPTGVGKTDVALEVAKRLQGEVLSADSRQVYRGLQVGTAKPKGTWSTTQEGPRYVVQGVVHHLLDHVDPTETYTAGRFTREAKAVLNEMSRRNVPAVIVGGTGLYFRSLVRGLALLPEGDPVLRKKLAHRAEREGRSALHQELQKVDPLAAEAIPPNNIQRVIRALEVHTITGRPLSALQKEGTHPAPWDFAWFGLRMDPGLYEKRLKQRCLSMEEGILAETKALLGMGVLPSAPAFQALGYREAVSYLSGNISKTEFEQELYQQTHLYAKRQLTWFRGEPSILWLEGPSTQPADILATQLLSHL